MRHLILVFIVFCWSGAMAKGLEGSTWRVKSHKLVGEEPSWTNEEAESVTGKTVSFGKGSFKMGATTCKLKATPQQDGRSWTAGEKDPCDGESLKGRVYSLSLDDCGARFPGFIVLTEKHAVAFGSGVSFCLEKK